MSKNNNNNINKKNIIKSVSKSRLRSKSISNKNVQKMLGKMKRLGLKSKSKSDIIIINKRPRSSGHTQPISNNNQDQSNKSNNNNEMASGYEMILQPEGVVHSTTNKYDCCALLIHCAQHNKLLLARQSQPTIKSTFHMPATWMPFSQMMPNRSWKHGAMWTLCVTLSGGVSSGEKFEMLRKKLPIQSYQCMQVARVQMPQSQKFLTRIIYYFKLNSGGPSTMIHDIDVADVKNCSCQQYPLTSEKDASSHQLEWFPMDEIQAGNVANLCAPELIQFARQISTFSPQPSTLPSSLSIKSNGINGVSVSVEEYTLEEMFKFVPRDPPRNLEEELLRSLHITEKDVERLYQDFMEHCFPYMYMSMDSFKYYMAKYECERDEGRLVKLFSAFNLSGTSFLTFHELLLGLACIEPSSQHGEFRVKFIFRYYDIDKSNTLSTDELRIMLFDMGTPLDQLDAKLVETINIVNGGNNNSGTATVNQLILAIGTHKFRGTSVLCRSNKSIFNQICRAICKKYFHYRTSSRKVLSGIIRDSEKEGKS